MSVVAFERKQDAAGWTEAELNTVIAALRTTLAEPVVLQAKAAISPKGPLMARMVVLWCAILSSIQQKFEPLLVEGGEVLVQVAPQLAAFA